jgi:hypothetical protein
MSEGALPHRRRSASTSGTRCIPFSSFLCSANMACLIVLANLALPITLRRRRSSRTASRWASLAESRSQTLDRPIPLEVIEDTRVSTKGCGSKHKRFYGGTFPETSRTNAEPSRRSRSANRTDHDRGSARSGSSESRAASTPCLHRCGFRGENERMGPNDSPMQTLGSC